LNPTDHPLYQDVETAVNQGDWQTAKAALTGLLDLYPNDAYLRETAAFVHTRSILVEAGPEIMSPRTSLLRRSLRFLVPVAIVLALLGLVVVALLALQLWILPRATEERQRTQITQIREEARTALTSGDYDRAMIAYNRILNLLPDDREARDGLEQAGELRATASVYSEAIAEMEGHHWESALGLLYQIEEAQPGYRDVEERIAFVQEQQALSARFDKAEAAFDRGYYELAIQEYEALQSEDSGFQRETLQDHLFLSYLQLGLAEEEAAGDDVNRLEGALEKLEKALTLRPDDSQARGESQLLRLYIASLDQIEAANWPGAVDALIPVYEARPDFAAGAVAQQLYNAQVAWADELYADGLVEEALAKYREARLIKDIQSDDLDRKIAMAEQMLVTPTPAPEPAQAAATSEGAGKPAARPGPAPTPTPLPLPYNLKGMSVKPNCDGRGYIHGIVWSAYNMPMSGIVVQAINTTTGFGPLVSLPTNADGIYQIVLEKDWIDGLWVVQVLENGQPASQAWGQYLGGGCVNGAQELKVDWQRIRDTQ
jgi:tetratricopeptide (TPR) repeat protein